MSKTDYIIAGASVLAVGPVAPNIQLRSYYRNETEYESFILEASSFTRLPGDLMLLYLSNGRTDRVYHTYPAGWNPITYGGAYSQFFWKKANGAEPDTYTFESDYHGGYNLGIIFVFHEATRIGDWIVSPNYSTSGGVPVNELITTPLFCPENSLFLIGTTVQRMWPEKPIISMHLTDGHDTDYFASTLGYNPILVPDNYSETIIYPLSGPADAISLNVIWSE